MELKICMSDKHHRYYKHTKFRQNLRGDPKFLVDLTRNDPKALRVDLKACLGLVYLTNTASSSIGKIKAGFWVMLFCGPRLLLCGQQLKPDNGVLSIYKKNRQYIKKLFSARSMSPVHKIN